MKIKHLVLLATLVLATCAAFAQGGFRGGQGMMNSPAALLRRDDVKAELNLSDDQKTKLQDISDNTRSQMRDVFQSANGDREAMQKGMADLMKKATDQINAILTDDQKKRLKEIGYQIAGFGAVATDKDLQTQLAVSDDQKTKLQALSDQASAANASIFEKMRNQEIQREEAQAAMKKNQDALNAGIEAILSADQKAKYKTLQGKVFVQTSEPGGFGRGGGGGR